MISVDTSLWDETVCTMVACQHPLCWEALRRIEKGVPRTLSEEPGRNSPDSGDELPTLKIVNLPFEYSQKYHNGCSQSFPSISKTISGIGNTRRIHSSSDVLFPPVAVGRSVSSEKNFSQGPDSGLDSHAHYCTPMGFSFFRPVEQQRIDPSMFDDPSLDQQIHHPALVVKWIPGVQNKLLQSQNSAGSIETPEQMMPVKELALESFLCLTENLGFRRKKSSKIPTGGQPYLLHLKKRQNQNQKAPNATSTTLLSNLPGKERNRKVSPSWQKQCRSNQLKPPGLLKSDIALGNRKGALAENKEKLVLPIIVKKAPSWNKCGTKVATKEKCLRKTQNKKEAALAGSVPVRCPVPKQRQQLDGTALASQLSKKAFAEKEHQSEVNGPPATSRRKYSVKFVEYKSPKTELTKDSLALLPQPTDGLQLPAVRPLISTTTPSDDNSISRTSALRSKTNFETYCKITTKSKVAFLSVDTCLTCSQDPWSKSPTQKSEESLLSHNPPPPPPSPFLSEVTENCLPDLTRS